MIWPGQGDTSQESNLSQNSSNERPGKFPELSEFMTIEGYEPKDVPGTQAPVDPGHIIYIRDTSAKDTRINNRVMLILFHNRPFSYTCLSFCCDPDFSGETLHNSHALVYTDQGQQTALQPAQAQQPNTRLPRLEIHLRHNNTPFSLKPDIYLNLREHWNIEQEVRLVILGRVERNSYKELVSEIKHLFHESITSADILRDSENPRVPNRRESAGREEKNSKQNDEGGVTRNTGKKKKRGSTSH
jgi:hypothetical protein